MKLIIGLGNPGKRYAKTRHNAGFMALDALQSELKEYGVSDWELSKKFNAEVCGAIVRGEKILLAKPMTFMNDSGIAVALLAHFYKVPPRDILVIHDDKDIKLGEIKIQTERGDAGHLGVRSMVEHTGSNEFTRIRVGIAAEDNKKMRDGPKFVLSKFGLLERKKAQEVIERTVREIKKMVRA